MTTESVDVGRTFSSVCLFVCLCVRNRSTTQNRMIPTQSVQTWYMTLRYSKE